MILSLLSLVLAEPPEPTGGIYGGQYLPSPDVLASSGWEIGGRIGVRVIRAFDLELEISYMEGLEWQGWSPRLNALYHVSPDTRLDGFFLAGTGAMVLTIDQFDLDGVALEPLNESSLMMQGGVGLDLWLVGPLHLRSDGRWVGRFGSDVTSEWEWNVGLDFRPELPPDLDGDGYKNKLDSCPEEAEDYDRYQDEDGCPEADNDRDGLRDKDDECPNEKEDKDNFDDEDGCPEDDNDKDGIPDRRDQCPDKAEDRDGTSDEDGCPDRDNDEDGISDDRDSCPDEAEDMDEFEDSDGCPESDNDQDGVPDSQDQCPNHPEDIDMFDDEDGCPDKDDDDDRVPDKDDTCPLQPEVYNGFDDTDGCPDDMPPEIKKFTGVIRGITFETAKAIIRPTSEPVLQEALGVFLRYPNLYMEIQGHTDDRGNDAANLELSQARADAVRQWFVDHGVPAEQLIAIGYGETVPMADNHSDAGRAENRRVEFKIIE